MNMIDVLKEEINLSLNEIQENTRRKLEGMKKFLKQTKLRKKKQTNELNA